MWLPVGMDGGKRVLSSLVCMHAFFFLPVCNGSRLNKLTPPRTNGNANGPNVAETKTITRKGLTRTLGSAWLPTR